MKHFISLFVAAAAFSSCGPANKPTLLTDLYARYDQMEQKVRAEATFSLTNGPEGGKPIVLQHGISFWGSGMETHTLPGGVVRYEFERIGMLPEKIPVHFKDNTGQEHHLDLQLTPIQDFGFLETPLQRGKGFTLTFGTTPLTESEKLIVIFTDGKNKSISLEVKGPSEKPAISFAPAQLTRLEPGRLRVNLARTNSKTISEGTHTWKVQTEFYTDEKIMELE